jgi:hypothetical protein
MKSAEYRQMTPEKMKNPQAGDYFSEMMSFYCFILKHEDGQVIYMEVHGGQTITRDGKIVISSYQEFHDHLQYDSDAMKGKYWVDYRGQYSLITISEWLEYFKEEIDNYVFPEVVTILEYDDALLECLGIGVS